MAECFKCGIPDERALLFDVVSEKGIVKVCRKCNEEEQLPLIKKFEDVGEPEERKSVYERVSSVSGFKPESYKKNYVDKEKAELLKSQETTLREIIDRNYKEKIPEKPKIRRDMIDNFHWVLMRARRSKKLTQKQLAEELAEPEAAIKLAEEGVIPEDSFNLIKKLENYLGVNISKKQDRVLDSSYSEEIDVVKQEIKGRFEEEVQFDELTTKILTISDLQEMKNKRENEIWSKDIYREKQKLEDKKDLTDEEMDEVIFGKRGK